jgi:hypothetical protein
MDMERFTFLHLGYWIGEGKAMDKWTSFPATYVFDVSA